MDGEKPNPFPVEIKAMNKAIADAQGEFKPIPKDKTAKAGSYSYDYADLATIIAACRPVLAKHGLAVVQKLEDPSGKGPALRTELRHADGGCLAASFPLGAFKTPQELGSWITYLRRYSYCAMLGIAAEEDDDGQSVAPVSGSAPSHAAGAGASLRPDTGSTETPAFKTPKLKAEAAEDLSAAQRRKIFAVKSKLTQAGAFTDDEFKAQLYMSFGVDSVSGLSKEQARDLIDRLLKREEELDANDSG